MADDRDSKTALTIEDVRRMRAKYGSPTGRHNAESKPPSQNIPIPYAQAAKVELGTALVKLSASLNKPMRAYDLRVQIHDDLRVPYDMLPMMTAEESRKATDTLLEVAKGATGDHPSTRTPLSREDFDRNFDYLALMTNPNPWSREETEGLMNSMRELAKGVKFEKPIPVDVPVSKHWDPFDDLPPQAPDLSLLVSKARQDVGGFGYGKSFRMRALMQHLANGGETLTQELSNGYGTGKTMMQFAHDESRAREMSWDLYRDTVVPHVVKFREPDLPRINAASVVADVQGELVPDNDETRPLTIDSFGRDFGEQLSECVSRPLRRAILDATIPGLRKSRVRSRRIGGS